MHHLKFLKFLQKSLKSVIVIDDDVDTVEVFSEYLKIKGYNVLGIGHNGKEAVELYEKNIPDVVVMDVMMPEYDGFYALERIREKYSKSKFVMVTGDLTSGTRDKLSKMSVSGLVYKPFDINDIINVIENLKEGQSVYPYRW